MRHKIRQYSSRGVAGLVSRIKLPGGVERSVYVAEQAGMDSDEPWIAVCETHGCMVSCGTERQARASMRDTGWCAECSGEDDERGGYRPNNEFRLLPTRPERERLGVPSIGGRMVLGLVINPKLKVPVLSVTDGEYVGVRGMMQEELFAKIGTGYLSETREASSTFTDLPRSHTPDGVRPRNQGYGTSLYSSLCLAAHLTYADLASIRMKVRGDGICSDTKDRSDEADAWWHAAQRRGLTRDVTEEIEDREENVDISGTVDPDALNRIATLDDADKRITYINEIDVDIETTSERTYDVYDHSSLLDHALCVASFVVAVPGNVPIHDQLSYVWHAVLDDPDVIEDAYAEPLLALDVRGLDADAISLLSLMYIKAGLKDPAIDAMRERWEKNLDPDYVTRQQSLFRANAAGIADVVHARRAVGWENLEELP